MSNDALREALTIGLRHAKVAAHNIGLEWTLQSKIDEANDDVRKIEAAIAGLPENDHSALGVAREALRFYAEGHHFVKHEDVWDTVSGEPISFYEDENCTATIEDGSIAKMALDDIAGAARMFAQESAEASQVQPYNQFGTDY